MEINKCYHGNNSHVSQRRAVLPLPWIDIGKITWLQVNAWLSKISWKLLMVFPDYSLSACNDYVNLLHIFPIYMLIQSVITQYWSILTPVLQSPNSALLLSAHVANSKSSDRSFINTKLHFKSLTLEMLFHHKNCHRLLPTFQISPAACVERYDLTVHPACLISCIARLQPAVSISGHLILD